MFSESDVARFWRRVDKRGPDECWVWQGTRGIHGYGQMSVNNRQVSTHRISKMLEVGHGLLATQIVCHHCDNPPCCNPAHLFVGTVLDNMRDAARKGRLIQLPALRGSENYKAKVTESQVLEIRAQSARGVSRRDLCLRFGIKLPTVGHIIARRTWTHV